MPKSSTLRPAAPRPGFFARWFGASVKQQRNAAHPRISAGPGASRPITAQRAEPAGIARSSSGRQHPHPSVKALHALWKKDPVLLYGAGRHRGASRLELEIARGNKEWAAEIPKMVANSALPSQAKYELLVRTGRRAVELCEHVNKEEPHVVPEEQRAAYQAWACEMAKVMASEPLCLVDDRSWLKVADEFRRARLPQHAAAFAAGLRQSGVVRSYAGV